MIEILNTSNKTIIMGVVNVTPDSFSDRGKHFRVEQAVAHAKQLIADGADIIDIGGESSRPGAAPVSEQEELRRILPLIEWLHAESDVMISADSYKPAVARAALDAGADMVNDITGLRSQNMMQLVAERGVPVVIMHMQGEPQTMQQHPTYTDVVFDIRSFFEERIRTAKECGIRDEQIILDPGIGFGKTLEYNLTILKRLHEFVSLGYPVLVGASRKSFIEKITGLPVEERVEASIAAHIIAVINGAHIIRVHDVKEHKRALAIVNAIHNLSN